MKRRVTLKEKHALSRSTWSLCVEAPVESVASLRAGQWFNVDVPMADGSVETRSYSVYNTPRDAQQHGRLMFAVTTSEGGCASNRLCSLDVGTSLQIEGPFGIFCLRPEDVSGVGQDAANALVFVATGSGLSPIYSMLCTLREQGPFQADVLLLFGARDEAEQLWSEVFASWAREEPRFRWEVTLSRPSEVWKGCKGYVQDHVDACVYDPQASRYFLCGRAAMIEAVRTHLKERCGVDRKRIRTEKFDAQ